jgi:hypothetical protein
MAMLDAKAKQEQRTLAGIEPIKISPEVKERVQTALHDAQVAGIKYESSLDIKTQEKPK